jgi:hypothetical protein
LLHLRRECTFVRLRGGGGPEHPDSGFEVLALIMHFLDASGEPAEMPRPARRLANFLVLLIDAATEALPACGRDTRSGEKICSRM